MVPFQQKHYYNKRMQGSFSIKYVKEGETEIDPKTGKLKLSSKSFKAENIHDAEMLAIDKGYDVDIQATDEFYEDNTSLNSAQVDSVSFDYADATTQKIKESLEDIANIVYNCTQSEFTLGVKFKSGEFYKCGEEVAAIYPLNDDVINDFIGSGKELFDGNSLTTWFDMIYANLKSIQDEATA